MTCGFRTWWTQKTKNRTKNSAGCFCYFHNSEVGSCLRNMQHPLSLKTQKLSASQSCSWSGGKKSRRDKLFRLFLFCFKWKAHVCCCVTSKSVHKYWSRTQEATMCVCVGVQPRPKWKALAITGTSPACKWSRLFFSSFEKNTSSGLYEMHSRARATKNGAQRQIVGLFQL